MARTPKVPEPKLTDFDAWQRHFELLYNDPEKRSRAQRSPYPRNRPLNQLKDAFYRYYRAIKKAGKLQALESHIQERDEQHWPSQKGNSKGSLWVIRLPEDGRGGFQIKSSTTRSRLATELDYADLNNIAPNMLLAFLYEAGSPETIEEDFASEEQPDWAERYRE